MLFTNYQFYVDEFEAYARRMLAIAYRPAWAGPIVPEVKPWAEEQLATLPANVRPYFIDRNIRRADFNVANKPADMADQATGLNPSRWD